MNGILLKMSRMFTEFNQEEVKKGILNLLLLRFTITISIKVNIITKKIKL